MPKLRTFTKEESREVIGIIAKWQKICLEYFDTRFVFASDEWFLTAGLPLPSEDEYEGYPQIENGVGMVRSLTEEVAWELEDREGDDHLHEATIATGVLIAPTIEKLCGEVCKVYPNLHVTVVPIINHFFGETITVSGLLTGKDIIEQLSGREIRGKLILPENLLRSGEDVLLDDKTVSDIENALQTRVRIVKSEGYDFVESLVEEGENDEI